ncbi:DNA-protecting protein DprA [Labedella populi]|uniref:DNA-protecting protein DprA n=1 Tax=Labedella populi TaxID=2498850 RepID=A0A444QAU5_9MICO|nr:DNA-processing protein DprA [Labedella populi]RWZ61153.1 DNA-protecting protein DprA [Labedella populi]
MSVMGLPEAEVLASARSVSAAESHDDMLSIFARGAWSCITEPGDGAAGGLVAALGAVAALSAVAERWSSARVRDRCESEGLSDIADAVAAAWAAGASRWYGRLDSSAVLSSFALAARSHVRLASPGAEDWPERLGDLGVHAPIALWVRCGPSTAGSAFPRSIALVGARAATGYGEHVTLESASGLVDRGFAIVSGAAYGIDGMAHRSALAANGRTMAFLAGGLDRPYPSGHSALIDRIAATGAVYSEVPCGAAPTKWRFLQRNRLIAASTRATVVLEAGRRSGSLNTAGHASALGRALGAVPGPVTSAASAGCHRLFREYDAICVTTAAEMAELAEPASSGEHGAMTLAVDETARSILAVLRRNVGLSIVEVAERTGVGTAAAQSSLAVLELEGSTRETATGWRLA